MTAQKHPVKLPPQMPDIRFDRAQNVRFGRKSGMLLLSSYDMTGRPFVDLTTLGNARFLFHARFGHNAKAALFISKEWWIAQTDMYPLERSGTAGPARN